MCILNCIYNVLKSTFNRCWQSFENWLFEIYISNKKKLYCTHCGYKFFISEVSFIKIIKCDKCNKNLDLPKSYYKINSIF